MADMTQLGKSHIVGLATMAFGITALSGYVSPNFKSLRVSHSSDVKKIKSMTGEITSLHANGDFVTCEFNFIPEGATTLANAILSAGAPSVLSGITITGLSIIAFGPFTDVFNTNAGNTQPWIYEGGWELEGSDETHWSAKVSLNRYYYITSATKMTTP